MKVTLELTKGDLADLQEILADDIARMNKKRNSGRVTPGQIFLLHGQQELLVKVNRQLCSTASDSPLALPCAVKMAEWSDMKALKNNLIVRTEKEADMVRAARINENKLHVRYLPGFKLYNVEDVRALLRRPEPVRRKEAS